MPGETPALAQQGDGPDVPQPAFPGPISGTDESVREDAKRFKVVAVVAGALLGLPLLVQSAVLVLALPTFSSMFDSMGGELPATTSLLVHGSVWVLLAIWAIAALVYWGFYRLARRYWIGLLFAPLFAVPFITSAIIIPALYLPMFQVITLVK